MSLLPITDPLALEAERMMYRRLGLGSIAQPPMSYGLGGLLRQLGVKPNGGLLMQILAQQYNPYLRAVQPPQFVRTPTATQGIRG